MREIVAASGQKDAAEKDELAQGGMAKSPQESAAAFADLCKQYLAIQVPPSPVEHEWEWVVYYQRILRFEAWPREHGKSI